MDELTNLMRLIDLNSKIIPEGDYLEMCNSIKKVHECVSRPNSNYDSDDENTFHLRVNMRDDTFGIPTPFSTENRQRHRRRYYEDDSEEDEVVQMDVDLPTADADELDELLARPDESLTFEDRFNLVHSVLPYLRVPREDVNGDTSFGNDIERLQRRQREYDEAALRRIDDRILETETMIRKTKPRQRITNIVKRDAVRKYASDMGIRLYRYTIGGLIDKGYDVGNEREFYKNYLNSYNEEVEYKLRDLNEELFNLCRDRDSLLEEMNDTDTDTVI
jgi:hypothetical protein